MIKQKRWGVFTIITWYISFVRLDCCLFILKMFYLPIKLRPDDDKKPCLTASGWGTPTEEGGTPGGRGRLPGGHTPPPLAHGNPPYGGGAAYRPYPAALANSAAALSAALFLSIRLIEDTLGAVALVQTPMKKRNYLFNN